MSDERRRRQGRRWRVVHRFQVDIQPPALWFSGEAAHGSLPAQRATARQPNSNSTNHFCSMPSPSPGQQIGHYIALSPLNAIKRQVLDLVPLLVVGNTGELFAKTIWLPRRLGIETTSFCEKSIPACAGNRSKTITMGGA